MYENQPVSSLDKGNICQDVIQKYKVKVPKKCLNHESQTSRGTKGKRVSHK